MAKIESFAEVMKGEKKRQRTRARLMDAAVTVIASRGLESASVQEIAMEADVANGTFYSHFRDKEEIVAAIGQGIASDIAKHMDRTGVQFEDAAYRVAYATQCFIQIAVSQPKWGWMYIHTFYLPKSIRFSSNKIESDIRLGIRQKRFTVKPDEYLLDLIAAIIKLAIMGQLTRKKSKDEGLSAAAAMLRVLGVSAQEAQRISEKVRPKDEA